MRAGFLTLNKAAQIVGSLGGRPRKKPYVVYRAGNTGSIVNWILITGFWDDTFIWIDTQVWID